MGNAQPKNMRKYASFLQEFVQKTDLIRPELKLNSSLKSQYTRSYKLDKAIPKGKSLSEALLFAEHRYLEYIVYKNCSEYQIQFLYTTCSPQV